MASIQAFKLNLDVYKEELAKALQTHIMLNGEDIEYAVDVLTFQHNSSSMSLSRQTNMSTKMAKPEICALFLTLTSRERNTGRFASYFNLKLNKIIKNRKNKELVNFFLSVKPQNFVELYENTELTEGEFHIILETMNKEYNAYYELITSKEVKSFCSIYYRISMFRQQNQGYFVDTLDAELARCQIPQHIYFVDSGKVYKVKFDELIHTIAFEPSLNPITHKFFSLKELRTLRARFSKEIKLYLATFKFLTARN
jgi:hypothetical protein